MRLLYLNAIGHIGGAERVLLDVLRLVRGAQPDWNLSLLLGQEGPLADEARGFVNDVVVLPLPPEVARLGDAGVGDRDRGPSGAIRLVGRAVASGATAAAYVAKLRGAIARARPDIVHSNSLKMHILGAWTRPADAALIWHLHDYIGSRPLASRLLNHTRARCSTVVANSESVAADAMQVLNGRCEMRTIRNTVDLDRFNPEGPTLDLDALAGLPAAEPGTVRVGLVATFALWKGHLTFLEALAKLDPAVKVRGYIVGGPLYQTEGSQHAMADLQAAAGRLGLASRVAFTGLVADSAAAMRALDVVVHASTAPEPFGLSIAEAMSTGRAVVVSHAGGARELVTPNVDALVHQPGDADGLAKAIERLATDGVFRRRVAWAARMSAIERFDPLTMRDQLANLYRSLETAAAKPDARLRAPA